ncbi:hypothetical protein BATDEDRAFT_27819 [Batrachochytrium dendrobatidis JAM81]|uniref:Uncharacterized protein n=1 Tax=Batrachochytrium dendrobatidis (strain JAM81 / FGSC 10211) TaxID=684364 RepID=F4PC71_BATDJ|nr:uncharacterized protein BATDEDRAFT_27819 [Batrachochytrium dendrobatidis JAM81]EGF77171.1 hypothetical protein BATDEDRAFT_27819 [Batrachochytrium dendrobatidis JAM81]|eukprot:XP_006682172.1 hypothetical protein BATDEDRAFT_27819 [Batrachochytrium dendrobatidis JAM81]
MTYAAVPIKKNNIGSTLDDMKQVYLIAGDIQPCLRHRVFGSPLSATSIACSNTSTTTITYSARHSYSSSQPSSQLSGQPSGQSSSLLQSSESFPDTPFQPYSASRVTPGNGRGISPRRAPPSPRTNQDTDVHAHELQFYGWVLLIFTVLYFSVNMLMMVGSKWMIPADTQHKVFGYYD